MFNSVYKDCPGGLSNRHNLFSRFACSFFVVIIFISRFSNPCGEIRTDCWSTAVRCTAVIPQVLDDDLYNLIFSHCCRLSENRRAKREGSGIDRAACVCREQKRPAGTIRGFATSTVSHWTFAMVFFNMDSKGTGLGVRIKEDEIMWLLVSQAPGELSCSTLFWTVHITPFIDGDQWGKVVNFKLSNEVTRMQRATFIILRV